MTIMKKGIHRESILGLALLALITVAQFAIIPAAHSSSLTSDDIVVLSTTYRSIHYTNDYNFRTGTTLEFEAPALNGWQFDYIYVNFGCEVGGVTEDNVTEVYSIEGGYIESCGLG